MESQCYYAYERISVAQPSQIDTQKNLTLKIVNQIAEFKFIKISKTSCQILKKVAKHCIRYDGDDLFASPKSDLIPCRIYITK